MDAVCCGLEVFVRVELFETVVAGAEVRFERGDASEQPEALPAGDVESFLCEEEGGAIAAEADRVVAGELVRCCAVPLHEEPQAKAGDWLPARDAELDEQVIETAAVHGAPS